MPIVAIVSIVSIVTIVPITPILPIPPICHKKPIVQNKVKKVLSFFLFFYLFCT